MDRTRAWDGRREKYRARYRACEARASHSRPSHSKPRSPCCYLYPCAFRRPCHPPHRYRQFRNDERTGTASSYRKATDHRTTVSLLLQRSNRAYIDLYFIYSSYSIYRLFYSESGTFLVFILYSTSANASRELLRNTTEQMHSRRHHNNKNDFDLYLPI